MSCFCSCQPLHAADDVILTWQQIAGNNDYILKVSMLGDSGVGKTILLNGFAQKHMCGQTIRTVGVNLEVINRVPVGDRKFAKVQLWDIGGSDETFAKSFVRGQKGFIYVYDVNNKKSFENVEKRWLALVNNNSRSRSHRSDILIGARRRKDDQGRQVPVEEGISLAQRNNMDFAELVSTDRDSLITVLIKFSKKMRKLADHEEAQMRRTSMR